MGSIGLRWLNQALSVLNLVDTDMLAFEPKVHPPNFIVSI